ncbi:hypothetical protein ABPG72_002489 [Tetrahymena utriculariae]
MQKVLNIKTSTIQTKITPSYMMENLTCSQQYIAYANINGDTKRVVVIKLKSDGVNRDSEIVLNDFPDLVADLKYIQIKNEWKLVVTGLQGFRIYSEDGKNLIKINKIIQNDADSKMIQDTKTMFTGICTLKCNDGAEIICVGSTNGHIYFSEYLGPKKFQCYIGIALDHNQKVNRLASCQTDNTLIVCNQEGDISLFMANQLKDMVYIKKFNSNTHRSPINCMNVLERKLTNPNVSNILACGDYTGSISLYDLNEYYLLFTINSHVRLISSLDCNHAKNEILSASEDSYVNVWNIQPKTNDISLSFSLSINDLSIVGANFQDKLSANTPIFLTCYEQEEIHVVQRA